MKRLVTEHSGTCLKSLMLCCVVQYVLDRWKTFLSCSREFNNLRGIRMFLVENVFQFSASLIIRLELVTLVWLKRTTQVQNDFLKSLILYEYERNCNYLDSERLVVGNIGTNLKSLMLRDVVKTFVFRNFSFVIRGLQGQNVLTWENK